MKNTTMFYAVIKGKKPGIYFSQRAAERQVKGYNGLLYHSFNTMEAAIEYFELHTGLRYEHQTPETVIPTLW